VVFKTCLLLSVKARSLDRNEVVLFEEI
jgi:hypothetical protein